MKIKISRNQWETMGKKAGWIREACSTCSEHNDKKDSGKEDTGKKSPKQHGFIDQCIKENKDKDSPGGYCASIVDKVKGTTKWRKEK